MYMYMYLQVPELLLEEYEAVSREGKGVGNTYQAGKLNIVRWALLLFFLQVHVHVHVHCTVPSSHAWQQARHLGDYIGLDCGFLDWKCLSRHWVGGTPVGFRIHL